MVQSAISIANISPSLPEETPVHDALMKQLAGLVALEPNKTTGVNCQIWHIGHYIAHSTGVRATYTQKATLQDVTASVSATLI
jgi:hypothetical protein